MFACQNISPLADQRRGASAKRIAPSPRRKTPDQIAEWGRRLDFGRSRTQALVYNSRMSAKVDSSLVQDGYQLYHHSFFVSKNGAWAVVQQGMNTHTAAARR